MSNSITRLHISPLSPDLLPVLLGTGISKIATNISYHTLQTFPENPYGYVDLPQMEADKVKKKINGAIVRGKKIQIEEARPKKRKFAEEKSEAVSQIEQRSDPLVKSRKMSNKERNVVPGRELSPERKVKRGWTEDKSDHSKKKKDKSISTTKSQAASKYTNKEELLFRTKVPKNRAERKDDDAKRRRKATAGGEVVHEFEKSTTMPSFLRQETSNNKSVVEYKDGEGWVDGDGNVVEKEGVRTSQRRAAAQNETETETTQTQPLMAARQLKVPEAVPRLRSTESSSSTSASSDPDDSEDHGNLSQDSTSRANADDTSSSGSSITDSSSEVSSDSSEDDEQGEVSKIAKITAPKPSVHPLEALFKKPTKPASSQATGNSQDVVKPSLEVQTSFSFFESHDDNDNNDNLPPMPMTPFSSQDLRRREMRSAAPTPDTANPSRMSSIFNGEESDEDLSETGGGSAPDGSTPGGQQSSSRHQSLQIPQTDFEKRFWENRGDNNRAWKARRRAVLKEKRQRENRARRPKNW